MKKLMVILTVFSLISFSFTAVAHEINKEIKGQVRDLKCSRSLSGAGIIIRDADRLVGTISDENGNFNLIGVTEGQHEVQIKHRGYKDIFVPLTVHSGRGLALEFEMEQQADNDANDKVTDEQNDEKTYCCSFIYLLPLKILTSLLYYYLSF
jgi:hypothetical protein